MQSKYPADMKARVTRALSLAIIAVVFSAPVTLTVASETNYTLETVADGLDSPWSIAFLPNGEYLITELVGNLRIINQAGEVSPPIAGVPDVYFAGQGGLFDVLLDPAHDLNQLIYLSYASGGPTSNTTTVVRGKLSENRLSEVQVIYSAAPKKTTPVHYGGRLAWHTDGTLLLTTGDGFDYREKTQDIKTHFGKTIRMNADGTPAAGNPFINAPYVLSYGHRNPQGLAVSRSGTIYQHEHGPRGGDEINAIEAGKNYGWPAITYGLDYNGAYISPFTSFAGMVQPLHVWTPSIAPSGLTLYEGDSFPNWHGDLFVGALVDAEVRRLDLENGKIVAEETLFSEIDERIRDIRSAPDGRLYLLTDGAEGRVIRVTPNGS